MVNGKLEVFVVDDDVSVCRALSVLLGTYGFRVRTFTSAEEFFRAVPDSVAGCLILDMHMPGLDGLATLRRLQASRSDRPVIMITADKSSELRKKVLKGGAGGLLLKPFNDQALVDLINSVGEKEAV